MKKPFSFVFALLLVTTLALLSCGGKATTATADDSASDLSAEPEDWTMMDEFHMVMAEAFHPYKDSANLQPAKELADQMASVAEKWAGSSLPAQVDNDNVKVKIDELNSGTKQFQETVRTGTDAEIGEKLNELHDLFHELQDAWYHAQHE